MPTSPATSGGWATSLSTILASATTAFANIWSTIKSPVQGTSGGCPAGFIYQGGTCVPIGGGTLTGRSQSDTFQLVALGLAGVAVVAALFAMFRK
jgi:hypothetical protein